MSDPFYATVNHRAVLSQFGLLRRVESSALVTGDREVLRVDDLVFHISLAQSVVRDEYSGLHLTTINPKVGRLDVTTLRFDELTVIIGPPGLRQRLGKRLTAHDADLIRAGVRSPAMEHAVRDHLRFYTGRPYPIG
uniref:Uncharacterized protein n=1 Tax=Streptomyces sp. F12 TaxID=1436084 RepID=V9Z3S2_9ACTN|nr:hypothetical protein [Streptomyces sp. F12]AHE40140.1 hypothetical protein pFRL6_53 [Streptomyces sp. F12]